MRFLPFFHAGQDRYDLSRKRRLVLREGDLVEIEITGPRRQHNLVGCG